MTERPAATALHLAAQNNHPKVCQLLLETMQIEVNSTDLNG